MSNILQLRCLPPFGSIVSDRPTFIIILIFSEIQLNYPMHSDFDTQTEMSCAANHLLFDCRGHTMTSVMSIRQLDSEAVAGNLTAISLFIYTHRAHCIYTQTHTHT